MYIIWRFLTGNLLADTLTIKELRRNPFGAAHIVINIIIFCRNSGISRVHCFLCAAAYKMSFNDRRTKYINWSSRRLTERYFNEVAFLYYKMLFTTTSTFQSSPVRSFSAYVFFTVYYLFIATFFCQLLGKNFILRLTTFVCLSVSSACILVGHIVRLQLAAYSGQLDTWPAASSFFDAYWPNW